MKRVSVVVMAAVLTCVAATSASAAPVLPDLVATPPGASAAPELFVDGGGARLLLRFETYLHNRGAGPLEVRGSSPTGGFMGQVFQRVYDSDGSFADTVTSPPPRLVYENSDGHDHWHLRSAARYSLWNGQRSAEVAPAMKVGFCLFDSQRVDAHGPTTPVYRESTNFCEHGRPTAPSVFMGISPGWRDIYGRALALQWVDISDTQPGQYWLRSDVDPDGVIRESDELNAGAFTSTPSIVNGYLAQPRNRGAVPGLGFTSIDLAATRFDDAYPASPGPPLFKIVSPPRHGTLDRPAGVWLPGSRVNYMPQLGYSGPDSFTFAARDSLSLFPRNPASAAVTLTVNRLFGLGSVAISGAPESLYTGTGTALRALTTGQPGNVEWSVDGARGGSRDVGTVSSEGLYLAPQRVPPAGAVRIRAESASGAFDEVAVRILRTPTPRPAPSVKALPPAPRATGNPLSRLRLARHGRFLVSSVTSARPGLIRTTLRAGGRRIGACRVRASAGRPVTCMVSLRRLRAATGHHARHAHGHAKQRRSVAFRARVRAALVVGRREVAVRQARLR